MNIKLFMVAVVAILLVGCVQSAGVRYGDSGSSHYKNGPPPHAPAHGYRHKHKKHNMSYDSGLGAYIILGWDNHYFDNNVYFRYRNGAWQASVNLNSGWHDADRYAVPAKLWNYKNNDSNYYKHKKEHPGKGHKPKKGY
ncbi:MAG: hypothetical protein ACKE9I_03230 [Methylophagaceae bacterium]